VPHLRDPLGWRGDRLRGLGGGSVRGSPCDGPARLRSALLLRPAPPMTRPVARVAASGGPRARARVPANTHGRSVPRPPTC